MTMFWPLVIAAVILATEILWRLPIAARIRDVLGYTQKAQHIITAARISDHWKERVLLTYSGRICFGSVSIFVMLVLGLMPVLAAGLIYAGGLENWIRALMQPTAIVALCVVSAGYIWIRQRWTRV